MAGQSPRLQVAPPPRARLAYVVNALNPGGTEKLVVEMSLAFAEQFELMVLCLDEPGAWAAQLRARGIPVHCLWRQPGLDVAMPWRLSKYFRRARTQIVHAHQCTPWFYCALSRIFYSAPRLLLEEHGRFHPEVRNRAREWVNRLLIRPLTHRFVAVSSDIRTRLRKYEGLTGAPIDVVYNGVAPELPLSSDARALLRAELGIGPQDFVVGTVGRFDPIKNLPMLVESLARSRGRESRIRGLLVGDGPVFSAIHGQIVAAGLQEHVHATGFRSDARALLQCMDLFVLASFSEGTSMALLEAMAARVPVAVTAVGGNPEIVKADETGWVVPSGAVGALADVFVEAAANSQIGERYAAAGRRRFDDLFTFERMIGAYLQRYQQLLAQAAQ
jgi:glycosyltransferase involved in cell wall biosynthesis